MGIAGQTAAIALQQKGWKVNLYEQSAKVLSPIGAGIALSGGALCLDALGVGHTWNKDGETIHQWVDVNDKKVWKRNFDDLVKGTVLEGHFSFIRRNILLNNLYKELKVRENVEITLEKEAQIFEQTEKDATVTFSDGTKDTGDIIVCADGIHSVGKNYILENSELAQPEHSGLCVFYSIATHITEKFEPASAYEITLGEGGSSACFPLSGGEMLFIVTHKKSDNWNSNSEDWTYKCTSEDLHNLFVEKKFYENQDFIDEKMVKSVTRLSHLGIFQQHILPKWHKGRVVIIGDAAHATTPFMGQGANQAIQDGYYIAQALEKNCDHVVAFKDLYETRNPETRKIIERSQMLGKIRTATTFIEKILQNGFFLAMAWTPAFILQKALFNDMVPKFLFDSIKPKK